MLLAYYCYCKHDYSKPLHTRRRLPLEDIMGENVLFNLVCSNEYITK
jgi:hypothetical protein